MRSRNPLARRRRAVISAAIASAVSLSGVRTGGAELTWDAGGASPLAPAGGTGNWNTTGAFWSNGVTDVAWNNAAPGGNVAIFGGSPGTVTIDTGGGPGVVVGGLTFNSAGYVIASSAVTDLLTLTPGATLGGTGDADIAAYLAGTAGFTKSGANTITLSGDNSATLGGTITVSGGALSVSAANNLGAAANAVTLSNNATLQVTGTFAAAQPITLGTGGGTVAVTAANTFTLATPLAGNANALTKTGTGNLTLGTGNSTRSGATTVNGGTLSATVSSAANPLGSGTISLSGGGTLELTPVAGVGTQGLSGRQFTSNASISDTARIDFTQTAGSTRTDSVFTLTQANNLAAPVATQWLGKLNILTGGAYTFVIGSDDGSRLWIDGNLVVQNDGPKGVLNGTSAPLTLSTGLHDVRVDFVNSGGNGNLNLLYSGPDQVTTATIPAARLFTAETNTTAGASNAVVIGTGVGDALNVSGAATIKLSGSAFTQAQLGNATFAAGSNLALATDAGQNGKALRLGGTTDFAAGTTTLNLAGDGTPGNGANLYVDGVVGQTGGPVTINKQGDGRLVFGQTLAANGLTAASLIDVQAGTLQLVGSSAAGSFNPIGAAGVRLSGAGTRLVLDSKVGSTTASTTFANAIDVTDSATIQDIVSGGSVVTLGGPVSVAAGKTLTLDAIKGGNPVGSLGAALVVSGNLSGAGNVALASTGVGTLTITPVNGTFTFSGNNSAFSGTMTVPTGLGVTFQGANASTNLSLSGSASYLSDGSGTGQNESIAFADDVTLTGASTLTTGRLGTTFAPLFTTATNKTAQLGALTTGGFGLTVANNNGYGFNFTGTATVSGPQTITVNTATSSSPGVVPGLTLSGQVTGTSALTKAGAGTLVLTNATNNFGGNIAVTGGVLGATSDAALGDPANTVTLNGATGGFEAFDTFATSRAFAFANATNANNLLLVAQGKTLTIDSALGGANGFQKGDPGVLVLTSGAGTISGASVVSGGALRLSNAAAMGTAGITVANNAGTALQLNGVSIGNAVTINNTGINTGGSLQALAGTNAVTGPVTLGSAATVGVDAGGTLALTNVAAGANALTLAGAGSGTINGMTSTGTVAKLGTGSWNMAAGTFTGTGPSILAGTLTLSGTATYTGTGTPILSPAGTLVLDNSGTNNNNRLNGRFSNLWFAGELRIIGNAAAATTEVTGGATNFTPANAAGTITLLPNAAQPMVFGAAATFPISRVGPATLLFRAPGLGTNAGATAGTGTIRFSNIAFTGQSGLAGTSNRGILPWVLADSTGTGFGTAFATYDTVGSNGIRPLGQVAGETVGALTANANVLATGALAGPASPLTINSLTIASGGSVAIAPGFTMQLDSGGVLALAGNGGISGGTGSLLVGTANKELIFHVLDSTGAPGASLNLTTAITGAGGLTKADNGNLTLGTKSYVTGTTSINGGTLTLNAGNNTLFPGQAMNLSVGGALDLNGTSQLVGLFQSPSTGGNESVQAGGTLQNAGAAANFVTNMTGNGRFAGAVVGPNINLVRSNGNTLTLAGDNTYAGATILTGGTTTLVDGGRLSGTSAIDVNYGTLTLSNTGLANNNNRVNDAAPITLRGGFLVLDGRAQTATTETLGNVDLAQGASNLNVTAGGTGINSSVLTIGTLTRSNTDATVNLNGAGGQLGSAARLIITSREAAPGLVNNIVGGWAVNSGADFLSYIPGTGLAALNAGGYAGYNGTALPAASDPTANIKLGAAAVVGAGGLNLNSLVVNGNVTFANAADTLNLTSGGLLKSAGASNLIGGAANEGKLTAGGPGAAGTQNLYLHNNAAAANTLVVNSAIVDNGAAPVRLVTVGYNLGMVVLNGTNTYSGGTAINGWNGSGGNVQGVTLGATGTLPGGGLTINNGLFTQTAGGVVTPQDVTLNGSSTLTLAGNNTLTSLTINNNGGTASGAVNTGGVLTLTNGITATSSNVATLPVVNGTISFGGTPRTLTVSPIAAGAGTITALQPTLNIAGVIQNAGQITVDGGGRLQLSGQSTFAGGVLVKATSGLVFGASSVPGSGPAVTSGPVGTGNLTLENGATLLSTGNFTIANPLVIQGNLNFAGLNNLTFTGATTVPAAFAVNVDAPQQTVSLLGTLSNPAAVITKTGYGNLILGTSSTTAVTLPGGGSLSLLNDGDGFGTANTIAYGSSISSTGTTSLTVGRLGTTYTPYLTTASNKLLQVQGLNVNGFDLTVNNNNGYGLEVLGTTALPNDQVVSVATATASNVTQGLTFSGPVTGAGGIAKQGAGTLVLNGPASTFGGAGKLVDVQAGVVAATSDGALGDPATGIRLGTAGTVGTFRASGNVDLANTRTVTLNNASNVVEVTAGSTLKVNSAFAGTSGTTQLLKADNGTLELAAANPGTWTGSITAAGASAQVLTGGVRVDAGTVRISDPAALGAATNVIAVNVNSGARVQVGGGITVPNPIVLNTLTTNVYFAGVNWSGQLQGVGTAGTTNTWSGPISGNQDATITADAGTTLNLTGGINQNVHLFVYGGAGTINVTTTGITAVHTLDKVGSGLTNIQVATAAPSSGGLRVYAGELRFSGAAGGVAAGGAANATLINPGATVTLDNTLAPLANRLGGSTRTLNSFGGNLNLIGNSAAVTELIGAPTFSRGQTTITVDASAGGDTRLTFNAASNAVAAAQSGSPSGATALFRGTSLGTASGAGVATIQGTTGGFTFNGSGTGGTGSTNKAILPWALIDTTTTGLGTSFATGDAAAAATTTTAVLRPLAAGEYATGNLSTNNNMLVTTALAAQATSNVNSLTIDAGGSIAMGSTNGVGNTLNVSSGGVLVRNGVSSTISGGILNATSGFSPYSVHTPGTASLTISSLMHGGNGSNPGFMKAGDGTVTLSTPKLTVGGLTANSANTTNWQTVVNQGTLKLDGGTNTLGTRTYLAVTPGGTLDLNGNSQYAIGLFTDGTYNGIANAVTAGGTVTNTSAAAATLTTDTDARNWAGQLAGNVFFNKAGNATTTVYTPQAHTAGTLINVGTISLRDYGTLPSAAGIGLNYAALTLDNTQAADVSGRVGAGTITMRGGTFTYSGRAQTASAESATLSLAEGLNVVNVTTGGTGVNSAVLTANLSRPAGSAATAIFGQAAGGVSQNGQIGNTPRMLLTAPALVNDVMPWAVISREFASYIPGLGVAQLNATGAVGYSPNTLATVASPTENIRMTAGLTLTGTGTVTVNTLNLPGAGSATVNLGGRTLNVAGGGLMIAPNADNTTVTFSTGAVTSGFANGAVNDLYLYHLPYAGANRQSLISAPVVDNGATPVRLVVTSSEGVGSANRLSLGGVNTYTGGTVVNGGTVLLPTGGVLPAGGVTLNNGALVTAIAGQVTPGAINPANVVTLNGNGRLETAGAVALGGLVFNNNGGGTGPVVNTFVAGANISAAETGRGTLTLTGASALLADSSNVTTTSAIVGRLDTATGATLTVNPILVNGAAVAPLQATVSISGWVASAGTITKAGTGVLNLNGQMVNTGQLNVTAGGVNFGFSSNTGLAGTLQSGSRYSNLNLGANAWLNLANTDGTIGSISGSGTVINVVPNSSAIPTGRTLNVGFDGTSTTFGGSFARFNDAFLNPFQVNKIGAGTLTLNGSSTTTNTLQVNQGGVTFAGAGNGQFTTYLALPTGTLTLDNSGGNLNNRLGGSKVAGQTADNSVLAVAGGTVRIVGNASAATTETVGVLNLNGGVGNPVGTGTLTLEANAAQPLTLTAVGALGAVSQQSTALFRGLSNTTGGGQANLALTGALGGLGGTGANGTVTMPIRPDILGDASAAGTGTGFLTKDSATGFLRPLATAELQPTLLSGATTANVNVGLTGTNVQVGGSTLVGSLTLGAGGGVTQRASLLPAGAPEGVPVTTTVGTGGLLAQTGNAGITVGRLTTTGTTLFASTPGAATSLAVTGVIDSTVTNLTKTGAGTLTLNSKGLWGGQTNVNEGTLVLAGGDNTLPVLVTAGAPTARSTAVTGSGTIDLNGTNATIVSLYTSGNGRYVGQGGVVTNSVAGAANTRTLTSVNASAQTFGGSITGNLNFSRANNTAANTLTLTGPNTYTGTTTVRGSTVVVADAGTLSGTSAIDLNYGGLTIDQSGLNPIGQLNPTRVPAAAPVTLRGGTLQLTAGGSMDAAATINTVNASQGHSTITVTQAVPTSSTSALNIGNLVVGQDATLNLTGGTAATGFFSASVGLGSSQVFITSVNGTAIADNITNKILPANILTANGEFTTYVKAATTGSGGVNWGVVTMNGTAAGAQATYDSNITSGATLPASGTANVRTQVAGAANLPAGNTTYNALALRTAGITLTFAATTDTLNLTSGGLALTGNTAVVGAAVGSGIVTSGYNPGDGTNRLYVHSSGATINSVIANNGATPVRLVANSFSGTLTLAGVNTYTGGTVVNGGGTVALAGAGAVLAGPAGNGLVLNGSTFTSTAASNAIAAGTDVVINGSGTLTLGTAAGTFTNTLNSITFNNNGGITNPTVSALGVAGAALTLNAANAITAVNDNAATVPTVAGTAATSVLNFAVAPTITTSSNANVPTDLVISAFIGATSVPAGGITKAGTGSVVLSNANTFTTGFNLNAGTLILGASSAGTPPALTGGPIGTGTLTMAGGTALVSDGTLRTLGNAVVLTGDVTFGSTAGVANAATVAGNGVTLTGTVALGGSTRAINVNSVLNTTTLGGVVGGGAGAGLTKTGPGTLVLSAANTFDGPVTINGGVLSAAGAPVALGTAQPLGTATAAGSIVFGGGVLQHAGTNNTDYSSRFGTADGQPFYIDTQAQTVTYATGLASATGGTLAKFGSGTLTLQAAANYPGDTNIVGGTLAFGTGNTSTGTLPGTYGPVFDAGTFLINRLAADVVNTGGINGSGNVTIDQGTLRPSAASVLGGQLNFGSGTAVTTNGALDLSVASATFATMLVQNNSAAGGSVTVGAGQSLTVNGNFTVGNTVSTSRTKLTMAGAGAFVVNNPGGTFRVGVGPTGTNVATQSDVDMSGLATFTANLGTAGSMTIGVTNDNQGAVAGSSTPYTTNLTLAQTSSITAGTVTVGASASGNVAAPNGTNTNANLRLGSVANTINANTLNIGTGSRDAGGVQFAAAGGTLVLRDAAGTGPVAVNMGTGTGTTTGNTGANVLDTTGHNADLLLSTVIMGNQARNGAYSNTISFNQGTMTVANLQMALRSTSGGTDGGANKVVTSTVNVGGGTANFGSAAPVLMAQVSTGPATTGSTSNAVINISGGAANFAATAGVAVNMAGAIAGHTANATMNLTGGTTTVSGHVLRIGGAGTTSATVNLDGGVLAMGGNNLGSGTANTNVGLTLASGTLGGLGEYFNAAGTAAVVNKTTAGVATLLANTYTGGTTVTAGTLLAMNAGATSATGTGPVTVNGGGTLGGVGRIAGPVTANLGATVSPGVNGIGTLTVANAVSTGTGGTGNVPAYAIDIATAATPTAVPGVENDVLALTGAGGVLDLTQPDALNVTALGVISTPTTYTVATFASLAAGGVFDTVLANGEPTQNADVNAPNYVLVTYNADNVQLTVNNVVPEPTTLGGLGLAAAGLLARRRRRTGRGA